MHKKINTSLKVVFLLVASCACGVFLILLSFSNNIVFFHTPTTILSKYKERQVVRVGGKVKHGSVVHLTPTEKKFNIVDDHNEIEVYFKGILPPLFKEGQGIVAKGYMFKSLFIAEDVLAKHDEKYMPPNSLN